MRFVTGAVALLSLLTVTTACERRAAPEETTPAAEIGEQRNGAEPRFGATAIENLRLVSVEVEVPDLPRGWEGARLAALSDFQLGLWRENEEIAAAAVQRAAEAGAEVFLLLGGYLADEGQAGALRRVLAPLRGRSAVAILSLYDMRNEAITAQTTSTLEELGITIARNGRVPLERGGDTLHVAGLAPNFSWMESWQQVTVLDTLALRTTPILLTPFPELLPRAPTNRYSLVLAGRTFCGDIEMPGTAQLAALNADALAGTRIEGYERLYRVRGNPLFITCGTGYTFVPVRLGAPAEVVFLTLRRAGGPAPEATPAPDTLP